MLIKKLYIIKVFVSFLKELQLYQNHLLNNFSKISFS